MVNKIKSGHLQKLSKTQLSTTPKENLSDPERERLLSCENVLERHLGAFFEVGRALLEIKNSKLYRTDYETFEDYCICRWEMTKTHAYRLLNGAEIIDHLSPMGDILPRNERQVRPLTGLPPKTIQKVWKRAIEKATEKPLTSRVVQEAVAEIVKHLPLNASEVNDSRESWQLNIKPLLQKALASLNQGDKETVRLLLEKMTLLIEVGEIHGYRQE